jgi:hypothetical protein
MLEANRQHRTPEGGQVAMKIKGREFAAAQVAYIASRAAFEVIEAKYQKALLSVKPLTRGDSEEEMDAHFAVVDGIQERLGYWQARERLIDAEIALIAWARGVIASDPKTAARMVDVERVFTQGVRFPAIRTKLISTCMRLAA